jgi:hypothetical protein
VTKKIAVGQLSPVDGDTAHGRLPEQLEIHPPDKYRKNNDGSFRAYEIYRYRITDKEIIVVCIRDTSMEPGEY